MRRPSVNVTPVLLVLLVLLALLLIPVDTDAQRRGRRRAPPPGEGGSFEHVGPDVGDAAIDFTLTDLDGGIVTLSELWAQRPVILVLGSLTSPEFRRTAPRLVAIQSTYPESVHTLILYTREAHPTGSPSPYGGDEVPVDNQRDRIDLEAPADLEARRGAARSAVERLKLRMRVVVDGMEDAAWKAYGPAPNNAFLIDDQGFVVVRQAWFNPTDMELFLRQLLEVRARAVAAPPAGDEDR